MREHVTQLRLALIIDRPRGKTELSTEEHGFEGSLIGAPNVANGAGVESLEKRLSVFAAREKRNSLIERRVFEIAL